MLKVKAIHNRHNRLNAEGKAPIHIRLTFDRKYKLFHTGIYIKPGQWSGTAIKRHVQAMEWNNIIQAIILKANKYYLTARSEGRHFDLAKCLAYLEGKTEIDFCEFIAREISFANLAAVTIKKHYDLLNKLRRYSAQIHFSELNYSWVDNFDKWLQGQASYRGGQLSTNYIASLLVLLRKYTSLASRHDLIKRDPFLGYKIQKVKTHQVDLTAQEIDRIAALDLSRRRGRFAEARDRFVFMCDVGMRFGDTWTFDAGNFSGSGSETLFSYIPNKTRNKTARKVKLPVGILFGGRPLEILDKYDRSFAPYDNSNMNINIRALVDLAGIKKAGVHSHTARHSFKSNLWALGFSEATISYYMGHSSIRTTGLYGQRRDQRIVNEARVCFSNI